MRFQNLRIALRYGNDHIVITQMIGVQLGRGMGISGKSMSEERFQRIRAFLHHRFPRAGKNARRGNVITLMAVFGQDRRHHRAATSVGGTDKKNFFLHQI